MTSQQWALLLFEHVHTILGTANRVRLLQWATTLFDRAQTEAREEERAACARIADAHQKPYMRSEGAPWTLMDQTARDIASAIRARGNDAEGE